jgi:hypothetical protein
MWKCTLFSLVHLVPQSITSHMLEKKTYYQPRRLAILAYLQHEKRAIHPSVAELQHFSGHFQ